MPSATKIALTVAGVGAVGGGVGLSVHMLSSEDTSSLKFKLTSEGFNTSISATEWTEIFGEYDKTSNKNVFQVKAGETKNEEWLEKKCKEILDKEDKQNTNYGLAIQWCVKPEKISDILGNKKGRYRLLDTDVTETGKTNDKIAWNEKIRLLGLPNNSGAKTSLAVQLSNSDEIEKIKEIKGRCATINALRTTSQGFVDKFNLAKQWCSVLKENNS
ncbi:hypothetical protein A6V39_00675 [Candidatus Mycoplasma haematobovis]|uniref:Uncharacterized protein n=1 Tax=Candidatus Mycoplasma haematobovis TaxID=432608 RepID=A0A1A9QF25_9MOLU|nr:hypothetical protein [Candidatus Mycoplasma haematobovis]OAL10565.1 hypothetical protein A6V39_00675 [Candidatus Mycoplasma haematobovis]